MDFFNPPWSPSVYLAPVGTCCLFLVGNASPAPWSDSSDLQRRAREVPTASLLQGPALLLSPIKQLPHPTPRFDLLRSAPPTPRTPGSSGSAGASGGSAAAKRVGRARGRQRNSPPAARRASGFSELLAAIRDLGSNCWFQPQHVALGDAEELSCHHGDVGLCC